MKSETLKLFANKSKEFWMDFKAYLQSEEFESDLDLLATRLNVRLPAYVTSISNRTPRVQLKLTILARHSRNEILSAAAEGMVLGAVTKHPKVIAISGALFGGAKGALIAYECYQVFLASKTFITSESFA